MAGNEVGIVDGIVIAEGGVAQDTRVVVVVFANPLVRVTILIAATNKLGVVDADVVTSVGCLFPASPGACLTG